MKFPIITIFLLYFGILSSIYSKNPKHINGIYPSLEFQTFSFIYEKEKRAGQEELLIRPFYTSYHDRLTNAQFKSSFYPLYYSQKTDKWKKWSFLFIFGEDSVLHEDIGKDEDLTLSPLFIWGKGDTDREKYFSVFPFYGNIRNKLSWSNISFVMFPLYTRWEYKEFQAQSILWPLTVWGSTDIRKEYRIVPLFSHKSHSGKYDHNSIFWPLISWGVDNLDKKEPSSYSFVWLLYSKKESYYGNMYSLGILPVIGSISLFSYGYDKRTTEVDYTALFFLLQYGYSNDKDYRKKVFFPFYGYSRFANKEFEFITPFIYRMETDSYNIKSNNFYFVPFFHYNREYFVKEERTDLYYKFWPLVKWHKDHEGTLSWNLLSFYPVRSETAEKVWDPIFSLIEYRNQSNGEKKFSMFLRLYNQKWSENDFEWNIPLLMDYSSSIETEKFRLFYGLLGYEKKEEKKYLQLFWFLKL